MKKFRVYDTDLLRSKLVDVISRKEDSVGSLIEFLYKDTTDKAHGVEHIHSVLTNAKNIKGTDYLTAEEILSVVFHDICAEYDRDTHNVIGAEYFVNNVYPLIADYNIDSKVIERAIIEHRAKYKGEFYSSVSELVSAADRGNPKSIDNIVKRSYQYAVDRGANHDEAVQHAIEHIAHKYSRSGYANFPYSYLYYYEAEMEKFYKDIDELNADKINTIMEAK